MRGLLSSRTSFIVSCRRGAALALVLWISLGLAGMALYFGHGMVFEYRAAANALAMQQADQVLEGGVVTSRL
jgi:type II secretory pathway component PulK